MPRAERAAATGTSLHLAEHHAGDHRERAVDAEALEEGGGEAGGGFRAHGLRGGHAHGLADGLEGARDGGPGPGGDGDGEGRRRRTEGEDGEAEVVPIHRHEGAARPGAEGDPERGARAGRDEGPGEVVPGDGAVAVPEGREGGDLLALKAQEAREDKVDEEGGDGEEDGGGDGRLTAELAELLLDPAGRGVALAAVGAHRPVGVEDGVDGGDDAGAGGSAREAEAEVVEGALHAEGRLHGRAAHPGAKGLDARARRGR